METVTEGTPLVATTTTTTKSLKRRSLNLDDLLMTAAAAAGSNSSSSNNNNDVGEDDDEDDDDIMITNIHHLSARIIHSTHVLLEPDFSAMRAGAGGNDENYDDRDDDDDDDGIAILAATTTATTKSTRTSHRRRSIVLSSRVSANNTIANNTASNNSAMFASMRESAQVVQGMINAVSTSSILNLVVASAGGVGMITLPGSFSHVGYGYGITFLIVSCLAASTSLFLLDWCCKAAMQITKTELSRKKKNNDQQQSSSSSSSNNNAAAAADAMTSSYAGLVAFTLGSFGSQTLESLTLAFCIGMVIGNLGAISKQITSLVLLFGGLQISQSQSTLIEAFLVMFPLSLLPEESSMRFAGIIGSTCMLYVITTIFYGDGFHAIKSGGMCSLEQQQSSSNGLPLLPDTTAFTSSIVTLLQNAPIFLFAMNGSTAYVPVRYHHVTILKQLLFGGTGTGSSNNSNKNESSSSTTANNTIKTETNKVIKTSVGAAGFCYLLTSCVVYIAYCNEVPENVVDAWPMNWLPGTIARICIIVQLTAAACGIWVPLGRAATWHLIYGPYETVPATGSTRILVTLVLISIGTYVSIALGGALALPLAITSALCVTAQMFVLPGLCCTKLLRLIHTNNNKVDNNKCYDIEPIPGGRCLPLTFTVAGLIFGALSLAALFGLL